MKGRTKTGKIKKGYRMDGTKVPKRGRAKKKGRARRSSATRSTAPKRRTRRTGTKRAHKGKSLAALASRVTKLEHFETRQKMLNTALIHGVRKLAGAYGVKLGTARMRQLEP
jgi:hypothetical protein